MSLIDYEQKVLEPIDCGHIDECQCWRIEIAHRVLPALRLARAEALEEAASLFDKDVVEEERLIANLALDPDLDADEISNRRRTIQFAKADAARIRDLAKESK